MQFGKALLAMSGLRVGAVAYAMARSRALLAAAGFALCLSVGTAEASFCRHMDGMLVAECALDKLMEKRLVSAMSVVEAARWRCPILDAYAEKRFESLVRDKGIAVDEQWRSDILALGCDHPRITGAGREVQSHIDDHLFKHLHASLAIFDRGRIDIIDKSRLPLLAALRTERDRIKARIEERSGDDALRWLHQKADRIINDILYRDDDLSRQLHWSVKAEIIRWTAPIIRREPYYQRLHRTRLWLGYRPDRESTREVLPEQNDRDTFAVSSTPIRLSEDNYPPGAAYAWTADAIHAVAHITHAGDLFVDVGWQPYRQRQLEPVGLVLRMAERIGKAQVAHSKPSRRFEAQRTAVPLYPRSSEILAARDWNQDFPRRNISQVRRFVFGAGTLDTLHAAGDHGAIMLDMTFRDEDGNIVSANDILKVDGQRCGAYCRPAIPLKGFSDTLHWATHRN